MDTSTKKRKSKGFKVLMVILSLFVAILLTVITVVAIFIANTISELTPLSFEDRHQFVNQVKDKLEVDTAGEIVSETYKGDGFLGGSYLYVDYEGEESFEVLSKRAQAISDKPCIVRDGIPEGSVECTLGQVEFSVYDYPGGAKLTIMDYNNGRDMSVKREKPKDFNDRVCDLFC